MAVATAAREFPAEEQHCTLPARTLQNSTAPASSHALQGGFTMPDNPERVVQRLVPGVPEPSLYGSLQHVAPLGTKTKEASTEMDGSGNIVTHLGTTLLETHAVTAIKGRTPT
ncbi:hypothetical protein P7K49_000119 [Saguinus oedipus]|uniref:Uncharacterized protein n=1 Tax=Saguinus oedipus TaxID=9490 RepID=A0ABQ9WD74_SAGOE|nr:hypothetical protein P7K49_000119 [Saguinus oedipus]